jgi:hypothetical protein
VGGSDCCQGSAILRTPKPQVSYNIEGPLSTLSLPSFVKEQKPENNFVFALASTSIPCPCTDVTVTVYHDCCIYAQIYAVGDGTVTASVSGSSDCCGFSLKALINGQESPIEVKDGDNINVSLVASGEGSDKCSICLKSVEDPCEGSYGQQLYIIRKNTNGQYSLNVSTLGAIQRVNRARKIASFRRRAILDNQTKGFRPKR